MSKVTKFLRGTIFSLGLCVVFFTGGIGGVRAQVGGTPAATPLPSPTQQMGMPRSPQSTGTNSTPAAQTFSVKEPAAVAPAADAAADTPTMTPAASPPAAGSSGSKASGADASALLPPEKAQPARIPRFETSPVIDGKLDDEVWQRATVLRDFYQIQPGDNIAPSQQTEVLLGYDAKFLYVAYRAYDEPGKVRATVAKRDAVWEDDNVGMFLDTFHDQRKAYALFFNPLGVQADGIFTDGVNEDYSLDIIMESKGVVTDAGYTVEIAIPFKSLRYEAGRGKVWGAHFFRRIKRFNNELDSWMPISRDKSGFINQAGRITGLEGLSTARTLELIPSLTLSETGKRLRTVPRSLVDATPHLIDTGRFINQPLEFDPGLTARLGLTPTVTLDLALNPDFAQVEADATVVTANQRFPIFFAEKRPFFLEGIDVFQTLIAAVNTRTIIDPDAAVKLTGKRGRNSFGIMFASDNAPGNFSREERADPELLPNIEQFLDRNAQIGVVRFKRDVGKENSIGLLATSYHFVEKHNDTGGVDARFRLNESTTLHAQALASTSRRFFFEPDEGRDVYRTGNGIAYAYSLDQSGRNWGYEYSGVGRSRFFRADVGFNRRFNTNNQGMFVRYKTDPKPKARLVSWRIFNFVNANFDWQGRSQSFNNNTQLSFNLQRQTFFAVGFQKGYERVFEEEFGPRRTATQAGAFIGDDGERSAYQKNIYAVFETTPSKKYSIQMFGGYQMGALDFDFGAGRRFPRVSPAALLDAGARRDPGPGNSLFLQSEVTYKPTDTLRSTLEYTKSRLVRNDTGRVAFDDNIFSSRTTYQFTRFNFVRARVDYSTLAANMRAQFLFGWTPSPGTSFYAGYNDDLNRNGFSPFSGHFEPGFRRNGRTFFIKLSYLFRRSF